MKTIAWTCCYLDGSDDNGGHNYDGVRYKRHTKYLEYMEGIKEHLNYDEMWFMDNNSNMDALKSLGGTIYTPEFKILEPATTRPYLHIIHFDEFLGRGSIWDYPYCWRALYFMKNVINYTKPNKILSIDTDFFITSKKLTNYFNNSNTGWNSFRCKKYGFPEAALFILNEDAFPLYYNILKDHWVKYNGKITMELVLPFTNISTDFEGDRYGETNMPQEDRFDYYGQCPVSIPIKFNPNKT